MGHNAGRISHHMGQTIEIKQIIFEIINDVSEKKTGSGVVIENTECNFEKIQSL